ncbi:ABC transporter ATP-binding protein [Eubacteriales bacterium OttesenSCG-928-N14]|nr:ABC transporter ATP-binding protein [Eubacteriales bacterium OttesenSCG-928-N14]
MLRIEHVSYRYQDAPTNALQDICCNFVSGKMSTIIGPSGSGKTTLLSIMAGLDQPLEGSIYIDDENLNNLDLDRYRRERVSMIFQAFHLFPQLTALENVCFPMELNGATKQQATEHAKELLRSVGIENEMLSRTPSHLSGGEQQRVAIARALASGAKILLADEPTGNLDSVNSNMIMDILTRLAHQEGFCIVVVTHNPSISQASDVVYQMKDGELTMQLT